jgi:curved DNA-binding protein CbpA
MQQIVDPYRALGVARSATDLEIKAAHRKLVKRYHPDTGSKSDTERFLRVQEAYRVLADPLARKEWDQKHAPGPVRADRSAGTTTRRRRSPAPKAPEAEPAETPPPPRDRSGPIDPRTQPRSSRAYTWSASEVPWWEEAGTRTEKRPPRRRPAPAPAEPTAPTPPKPMDEPTFTAPDMDVYNRSSGAAWSMAARAYFRKGDAELPNRGSFHHEGTQVFTAGRARSAADAQARRRAAAASPQASGPAPAAPAASAAEPAPAAPSPSAARQPSAARPAQPTRTFAAAGAAGPGAAAAATPSAGTTRIVRRSIVAAWPTLGNRFTYALVAWLPIAAIMVAASAEMFDQNVPMAFIVISLGVLLAVPRLAYVAAVATVLALVIGGLFVGGLVLAGRLPSIDAISVFIGVLLVVAYVATAAVIAIGPRTLRPWSAR